MNSGSRSSTRWPRSADGRDLAADVRAAPAALAARRGTPRSGAARWCRGWPRPAATWSAARSGSPRRPSRRRGAAATDRDAGVGGHRGGPAAPTTAASREMSTAMTSGPLAPGPKPVGDQVVGAPLGPRLRACVPSSGKPSRRARTGAARASSSSVAADGVRRGVPGDVGAPAAPAATRRRTAGATPPPGTAGASTRCPASPRSAGSSVIEASTITSTTTEMRDRHRRSRTGSGRRPDRGSATTTVPPAKTTARPAVASGAAHRLLDGHARRRGARGAG